MAQENQQLTNILEKIYFHDFSDPWNIKEAQLTLLDRATGEQIARIAYEKQWLMPTLLVNVDTVIDEYNTKVQKQLLRDIKKINFDLISLSPRENKRKRVKLDFDEVERRLLQETIDETVEGIAMESDDESIINISDELKRRNIIIPDRLTIGKASPSYQRDEFSEALANISLREFMPQTPYDVHSDLGNEQFGELNLMQLGEAGMLGGTDGKMVYRTMKERERNANLAEDNQQTPEPGPNVVSTHSHISPKVFEALRRISNTQMIDSINQQEPLIEGVQSQVSMKLADMRQTETEKAQIVGQAQASAPDVSNMSFQHVSRREMFDRLQKEVQEAVIAKKLAKNGKVRRRQRRVSPQPRSISNREDELEIFPPLIRHKRKPRIPKLNLPETKMNLILNVFDDFDHYVDDDPLWTQTRGTQEDEVMLDHHFGPRISTEARASTAEIYASPAKRQRTERSSIPDHQLAELSQVSDAKRLTFQPEITSTVRKLTEDDIELAQLQESALPREEIIQVDTVIGNMSRSRHIQSEVDASPQAQAEVAEKLYECSSGRYQLGTTTFVDLKRGDGTKDRQSLYAMETVAFYMQIRFILARSQWKMKFTDLLPQLSLLNAFADDKIKESRITTLSDYGLLKLHWDDVEDKINDVEIITNL